MMFDEDEPRNKPQQQRNLEPLSIAELENYISALESEIERVKQDIAKKKAHADAAASVFKA